MEEKFKSIASLLLDIAEETDAFSVEIGQWEAFKGSEGGQDPYSYCRNVGTYSIAARYYIVFLFEGITVHSQDDFESPNGCRITALSPTSQLSVRNSSFNVHEICENKASFCSQLYCELQKRHFDSFRPHVNRCEPIPATVNSYIENINDIRKMEKERTRCFEMFGKLFPKLPNVQVSDEKILLVGFSFFRRGTCKGEKKIYKFYKQTKEEKEYDAKRLNVRCCYPSWDNLNELQTYLMNQALEDPRNNVCDIFEYRRKRFPEYWFNFPNNIPNVYYVNRGELCGCVGTEVRADIPEGVFWCGETYAKMRLAFGGTFYNRYDIKELNLPSTFGRFEDAPFWGAYNVEKVTMSPKNPYFYSQDNCIIERKTGRLVYACKGSKIPKDGSVVSIADSAYCGVKDMRCLYIPEPIKDLESFAFTHSGFCEIILPKTVKFVPSNTFFRCRNLREVHCGEDTVFDENAFEIFEPGSYEARNVVKIIRDR